MSKLTIEDIVDLREYERERESFRSHIINLKKLRRVALGELMTIVFENRDTMRFQIQEMARAEKMLRDDQILTELEIYNPLIPERGELKATLFLELTSKELLMEWLPKLVGIEESVFLQIGEGNSMEIVRCQLDEKHKAQLTREEITASVHYIEWHLNDEAASRFGSGEAVFLGVDHPNYSRRAQLSEMAINSLKSDWA